MYHTVESQELHCRPTLKKGIHPALWCFPFPKPLPSNMLELYNYKNNNKTFRVCCAGKCLCCLYMWCECGRTMRPIQKQHKYGFRVLKMIVELLWTTDTFQPTLHFIVVQFINEPHRTHTHSSDQQYTNETDGVGAADTTWLTLS